MAKRSPAVDTQMGSPRTYAANSLFRLRILAFDFTQFTVQSTIRRKYDQSAFAAGPLTGDGGDRLGESAWRSSRLVFAQDPLSSGQGSLLSRPDATVFRQQSLATGESRACHRFPIMRKAHGRCLTSCESFRRSNWQVMCLTLGSDNRPGSVSD